MSDAALLRAAYPERHTAKIIARDFGVSIQAVYVWLSGGALPKRRRPQLRQRIEAEIARRESEIAALRERIQREWEAQHAESSTGQNANPLEQDRGESPASVPPDHPELDDVDRDVLRRAIAKLQAQLAEAEARQ